MQLFKVKPLEWAPMSNGKYWTSTNTYFRLVVECKAPSAWRVIVPVDRYLGEEDFKTFDEAKDAASEYYRERLASCLIPSTQSDVDEWRAGR